jgi:integrase/recombinase XerD
MKHLQLTNPHYKYLEKGYKEWLDVLGYADGTVQTLPVHLKELLYYLEQKNVNHITSVTAQRIYNFVRHLKERKNLKTGAGLSSSTINKTLLAVSLFAKYLYTTGKHELDVPMLREESDTEERNILSLEEIKALYESSFSDHRLNFMAMGQRDRAMIAIFYGCGLRRMEGIKLNITDIDTIKGLLFVRKGKGSKQRHVPIAAKHLQDIKDYLEQGRNWFMDDHKSRCYIKQGRKKQDIDSEAFFLSMQGKRMGRGISIRLHELQERAGIEKSVSPHILRHSIATHLLQSGMKLEEIAKFLGHSSLESTQIYTHIVNQEQKKEQYAELLSLAETE